MILNIGIDELEKEFRDSPWKLRRIYNIGIDYMTNEIDGMFEDEEKCVFKFDKYDITLSNRWHDYKLSAGEAGITIEFISTK